MRALPVQITDEGKENKVDITDLGAGVYALKVDASGSIQPVSGTVAVSNFPADQLVHATNLDVALSTRNAEATQLLVKAKTDNLDVALSTRATEATLATRASEATLATRNAEATQLLVKTDADTLAGIVTAARAAVNPIVGQAGVQGGGGVVTALTQRVTEAKQATYSCAALGIITPALSTDIFVIVGSATKTVKITKIETSATRTVSGSVDIVLLKRSTDDTLGVSTTPATVPHDSTSAAATAVVRAYTVNPVLGTLVGSIRNAKMFVNTAGTGASDKINRVFGADISTPIVLRGINEILAVNLNATTIVGGNFDVWVEWTEET